MSKSDTCKQLLANYCKTIASNSFHAYDYQLDADESLQQKSAHNLAINPANWKRLVKLSKDKFDTVLMKDEVVVRIVDEHGNYVKKLLNSAQYFIYREFICAPERLDTSIAYIVWEDSTGNLYVGDDIGD